MLCLATLRPPERGGGGGGFVQQCHGDDSGSSNVATDQKLTRVASCVQCGFAHSVDLPVRVHLYADADALLQASSQDHGCLDVLECIAALLAPAHGSS